MRDLLEKVKALPRRVESIGGQNFSYVQLGELTGLIEAELARPNAEPVAWIFKGVPPTFTTKKEVAAPSFLWEPLFLHPPLQQEPLSLSLIDREYTEHFMESSVHSTSSHSFEAGVRFAERAHGIGGNE